MLAILTNGVSVPIRVRRPLMPGRRLLPFLPQWLATQLI